MILEIQHETAIEYSQPVSEWLCELRMEPVSDAVQRCHSFRVSIGQPVSIATYVDGFGNRVHHFNLLRPPSALRILAASVVETEDQGIGPMASQTTFSTAAADYRSFFRSFIAPSQREQAWMPWASDCRATSSRSSVATACTSWLIRTTWAGA